MSDDRRGRCYELAAQYVLDNPTDYTLKLCHGWSILA